MSAPKVAELVQVELANLNDAFEAAGIFLAVEVRDGSLVLSGEVDSTEMRDAALDLAGVVAEHLGLTIEDAIEVIEIEFDASSNPVDDYHIDTPMVDLSGVSDVGTTWGDLASEEGVPFFPPTDPVLGTRLVNDEDPEVIGGFQATSMDDDEESVSGDRDDEQISEDVRRELREDSLTTDLAIRISTDRGITYLTGEVQSLDDAENAEAVAARVPWVREVRENLTIRDFVDDRNR